MRKLTLLLSLAVLALSAIASGPALAAPGHHGKAGAAAAPRPAKRGHWFAGTVTAVGTSSLSVGVLWTGPNDATYNGQTVTIAVPSNTKINGPKQHPLALASIQVGELVAVRTTGDDAASLSAVKVRVFCNCHWVGGTVASVAPGATTGTGSIALTVKRTGPYDTMLDNTTVTIQVDPTTVYLAGPHHRRLAFSDLKVGEGVGVVFSATGFFKAPGFNPATATFTAKRVHAWGQRHVPLAATDATDAAGTSVG